ncbi:MAG: TonB-dependent receptor [bacterium]
MQPKHWYALLLLLLVPGILFSQSGKVRGTVVDVKSKDPLIGANVVVEGTTMGAVSDVNGEYLILNVPAGTYALKASYVGYQSTTVRNIIVSSALTTERNFELTSTGVDLQGVEIIAERPLVNKSATSSVRVIDQTLFDRLPSRGINAAIALQPGLVAGSTSGTYYIRGSRLDETGWALEGVSVRDPFTGNNAVTIIAEAVEEVQVMTGGYSAEFGGANAGLIRQQLRSGSESWRFGILAETDRWAGQDQKQFGTYSTGYHTAVLTAGGPLFMDNLRAFISAQNQRTLYGSDPTWNEPKEWGDFVTMAAYTPQHPMTALQDTIKGYKYGAGPLRGGIPGKNLNLNVVGTVTWDLKSTQVRFGGSMYTQSTKNGIGYDTKNWNPDLTAEGTSQNYFADLKITQFIDAKTFLEVSGSFYGSNSTSQDPIFKDNFYLYGDSAANWNQRKVQYRADGTTTSFWTPALGDRNDQTAGLTAIAPPGTGPTNGYNKNAKFAFGGKVDFTTQLTNEIEVKVGGEYQVSKYRNYSPPSLQNWAALNKRYPNKADFEKQLIAGSNIIGYDLYGNEREDALNVTDAQGNVVEVAPKPIQPAYGAGYIQTKIELRDIVMNIGMRYDYIATDIRPLIDPSMIKFSSEYSAVRANNFAEAEAKGYIQPRFGFSFPVTDRTVFHAQFGKFVGQGSLGSEVASQVALSGLLRGQFFYSSTYGFGLKPQKSTQYELGFAQQFSDNASFDITAFYKNIIDQVEYRYFLPTTGSDAAGPIPLLTNGDFATTKGLELKFTLRRTNRVQVNANYTLSDSKATGMSSNGKALLYGGSVGSAPFIPKYILPTSFNNPHRGNIMLDYRFGRNDGGPIFEQMGLNLLFTFRSGTNYTREENKFVDGRNIFPLEEVGASMTPWFMQLDGRIDKTFQLGTLNANVYIRMNNIPNSKMATSVYNHTGDVYQDGYFTSPEFESAYAARGKDADRWKAIQEWFRTPGGGGGLIQAPRTIIIGVKLEY